MYRSKRDNFCRVLACTSLHAQYRMGTRNSLSCVIKHELYNSVWCVDYQYRVYVHLCYCGMALICMQCCTGICAVQYVRNAQFTVMGWTLTMSLLKYWVNARPTLRPEVEHKGVGIYPVLYVQIFLVRKYNKIIRAHHPHAILYQRKYGICTYRYSINYTYYRYYSCFEIFVKRLH